MFWIGFSFSIGCVIGGCVSLVVLALLVAARNADESIETLFKNNVTHNKESNMQEKLLMEVLEQEIKKGEKVLDELTEKFSARPGHEKEQSIVALALDYGRELGHFHAYSYMISLIMYNSETD